MHFIANAISSWWLLWVLYSNVFATTEFSQWKLLCAPQSRREKKLNNYAFPRRCRLSHFEIWMRACYCCILFVGQIVEHKMQYIACHREQKETFFIRNCSSWHFELATIAQRNKIPISYAVTASWWWHSVFQANGGPKLAGRHIGWPQIPEIRNTIAWNYLMESLFLMWIICHWKW